MPAKTGMKWTKRDQLRCSPAHLRHWADASAREGVRVRAERPAPAPRRVVKSFAVVNGDGGFLGGCGINQIHGIHRFGTLGYWVRTSATGRGVATEAVRRAAEFAFRNTDLVRLEILCAVGSAASQRVAVRAGAAREGGRSRPVLRLRMGRQGALGEMNE
jgi:RimJ/RimL family protein N-acetyltransferase